MRREANEINKTDTYIWGVLFSRQAQYLQGKIWDGFFDNLYLLGLKEDRLPNLEEVNKNLFKAAGWSIQEVNGFVPAKQYLTYLSNSKFPVNLSLRTIENLDHAKEPDLFHDVFGHLHLLLIEEYSFYLKQLSHLALGYLEDEKKLYLLAQFNKWTTEFGVIEQEGQLKIYGAGLVSSIAEARYVLSDKPEKKVANVTEMLKTPHQAASLQSQYFMIPSFQWLADSLPEIEAHLVEEGVKI